MGKYKNIAIKIKNAPIAKMAFAIIGTIQWMLDLAVHAYMNSATGSVNAPRTSMMRLNSCGCGPFLMLHVHAQVHDEN